MIRKSLLFCFSFILFISTLLFAQKTYTINVTESGFIPDYLEVNIGDTVRWIWDSGSHIITSDDKTKPEIWNIKINESQKDFRSIFKSPDTYNYHCEIHDRETGTIVVREQISVGLESFTADYNENRVLLNWETSFEDNNKGFEIERQKEAGRWMKIAFIDGKGTSLTSQNYSYEDKELTESGTYYYRLKQITGKNIYKYLNKVKVEVKDANSFQLFQNYPNPFNPVTNVKFVLPEKSFVQIAVYNVLGNKVALLVSEEKPAGYYETTFDGSELSSGIYYLQMTAGKYKNIIKMILIR